jgi:hypothetical protein
VPLPQPIFRSTKVTSENAVNAKFAESPLPDGG